MITNNHEGAHLFTRHATTGVEKETMLMIIHAENTVFLIHWHRILTIKWWVSERNFGALSPTWDI